MNKYFSDYLPPALVKDLRQAFRTPVYVGLLCIFELLLWIVQGQALREAYQKMMFFDNRFLLAYGNHDSVDRTLFFCAAFFICLLPAARAYAAVRGDTAGRGTNFMMLTPLTSRRIVWGIWCSAVVQMLVMAVATLPLVLLRASLGIGANDVPALLALLPVGAFFAAAFLLMSRLHILCRLAFGVLLYSGVAVAIVGLTAFSATPLGSTVLHVGVASIPADVLPVDVAVAVLVGIAAVVALMLEFARRHYAPLAENCAAMPRLLMLFMLGLAAALCYAQQVFGAVAARGNVILALAVVVCAAAVAEALLPAQRLAVHERRCLPGVPALLQLPGVGSSALCIVLAFVAAFAIVQWSGIEGAPCAAELSNALYAVLLTLLLTDMMMKGTSPFRPVCFVLVFVLLGVLYTVLFEQMMLAKALVPIPYALKGFILGGNVNLEANSSLTCTYMIEQMVSCALFLAALLWRGRLKYRS